MNGGKHDRVMDESVKHSHHGSSHPPLDTGIIIVATGDGCGFVIVWNQRTRERGFYL